MVVWLKLLHISMLVVWTAGLLYLPGLLAAHATPGDKLQFRRLRIATRFTHIAVTSPAAILAIASGTALVYLTDAFAGWLVAKLTVVALMVVFHVYCGRQLGRLAEPSNGHRPATYLAMTAVPCVLVPIVLYLVLAQPF